MDFFFSRITVGKVDLPPIENDLRGRLLGSLVFTRSRGALEAIAEQFSSLLLSMIIGRPPWPRFFHVPHRTKVVAHRRVTPSELIENVRLLLRKAKRRSEAMWS
jgi:hypothetical protein